MKLSKLLNELQGSSRRATLNISAFDLINTMDKVEQMGIPVDRYDGPTPDGKTYLEYTVYPEGTDEDKLFRLPPDSENEKARGFGKIVEAKEFERLKQNAIRWMRITEPNVAGIPDAQVSMEAFRELVSKWNTLTDKQKEEWDAKSSKTTTGFMEWSKASINNVLNTMVD